MNILVTGAAGFIGSHLCERLLALGHSVRGIDNFNPYYDVALKEENARAIQAAGTQLHRLDLTADPLAEAVAGVHAVFHAAAQPGLSAASFDTYVRNNIHATYRLLEALHDSPSLTAFVNIATSSVYGSFATEQETAEVRPTSYYGVTKLAAEQLVMAYARDRNLPACSVRLYSVYGPRERPDKLFPKLIRALLEDTPLPLYEGSESHRRSYTYIDDILDGLTAVLNRWNRSAGEIFNIGTDSVITTGEGIRLVEEIFGKHAVIQRLPRRAGDQTATQADISKARRLLDYHPQVLPAEGLRRTVAWYREFFRPGRRQ
jgi:nucleoside-diphosphate-sugar epimerase